MYSEIFEKNHQITLNKRSVLLGIVSCCLFNALSTFRNWCFWNTFTHVDFAICNISYYWPFNKQMVGSFFDNYRYEHLVYWSNGWSMSWNIEGKLSDWHLGTSGLSALICALIWVNAWHLTSGAATDSVHRVDNRLEALSREDASVGLRLKELTSRVRQAQQIWTL